MTATENHKTDSRQIKPYDSEELSKKEEVALMFNNISHRYDLLNHLLSFGIDKGWRKVAIKMLASSRPQFILDVATGTGDFAISALAVNPKKITGVDISEGMLEEGRKKIQEQQLTSQIELLYGDSENLPFSNNTFDAVTVAFGVRNFENLQKGLNEIYRVLKPGGTLIVLEFSKPAHFPVKYLYMFYFKYILPAVGRIVSGDNAAYRYLHKSVSRFPEGKAFMNHMSTSGLKNLTEKRLTFGIASVYKGVK